MPKRSRGHRPPSRAPGARHDARHPGDQPKAEVQQTTQRRAAIDVDNGGGGGYGWGGAAAGVAVGAAVGYAASAGTVVYTLPAGCTTSYVNGITYSNCGGVWYEPSFAGSSVSYTVVNAP